MLRNEIRGCECPVGQSSCWGGCKVEHDESTLFTVNGKLPKHNGKELVQMYSADQNEHFNDSTALLDITLMVTFSNTFEGDVGLYPQMFQAFHKLPKLSNILESISIWKGKRARVAFDIVDPRCEFSSVISLNGRYIAVFAYQYEGYGVIEVSTPTPVKGLPLTRHYQFNDDHYLLIEDGETS